MKKILALLGSLALILTPAAASARPYQPETPPIASVTYIVGTFPDATNTYTIRNNDTVPHIFQVDGVRDNWVHMRQFMTMEPGQVRQLVETTRVIDGKVGPQNLSAQTETIYVFIVEEFGIPAVTGQEVWAGVAGAGFYDQIEGTNRLIDIVTGTYAGAGKSGGKKP